MFHVSVRAGDTDWLPITHIIALLSLTVMLVIILSDTAPTLLLPLPQGCVM